MSGFDPQLAIGVLTQNVNKLGHDQQAQQAYIAEAMSRLTSDDDKREATKLAVEAAKMFLTIALAVLIGTGPWVQYLHTTGVPWFSKTMGAFYVAAAALILSIWFGFHAISSVFKRADGRPQPVSPPWSTEPITYQLNGQAVTGLVALLSLLLGLFMWGAKGDAQPTTMSITIPGTTGFPSPGRIIIEGDWIDLRVKTNSQHEITLPSGKQSFSISCQ